MKKAPIAFFAYKRPDHTLRSLISLAENEGAKDSELFIFCDGAKKTADQDAVNQVREIVRSQQWCGTVSIVERQSNIGLANSIISGVTELCQKYGRVIVLEDDLVLSPFFLDYMNKALNLYENYSQVMQVSGYMFPVKLNVKADAIFLPFITSWGWATWQRAWQHFDPNMPNYEKLKNDKKMQYRFNLNNSYPYFKMLESQRESKMDSWAIRWYLNVFMLEGLTVYATQSLVVNIGFDGSGTHCGKSPVFDRSQDRIRQEKFRVNIFPELVEKDPKNTKNVFRYLQAIYMPKISIYKQIFNKIRKIFSTIVSSHH